MITEVIPMKAGTAGLILVKDGRVVGAAISFSDLAQEKQAEAAVKQGEEKHRTLLDTSPDGIFLIDLEKKILMANQRMVELLGYDSPEAIMHRPLSAFVSPQDWPGVLQNIAQVMETGTVRDVEHIWLRKDGTFFPLEISAVIVRDPGGQPYALMAVVRDITERKKVEQERLEHLRFFENMDQVNRAMQTTNDLEQMMCNVLDAVLAIFDCDRAWLIYPCDPEAAAWRVSMERTRPEYPSNHGLGVEFPTDPEFARGCRILRAANGPVKFDPESEQQLPAEVEQHSGCQSMILMAIYPKGDKPYIFGLHQCSYPRVWTPAEERLFHEIGRRMTDGLTSLLMYRNLRESEQKYRLLVNQIPAVVFKGYADWSVDFFDHKVEIMTDYPKEDFDSRKLKWSDLILPEDFPEAKSKFSEALKGDKSYVGEYRIRKKTGDIHWVQNLSQIFCDADGRVDNVSGILFDITDRKQAEERLSRYSRTHHASAAVNEALIRATAEETLLQAICRIIIDIGGYRLAWVGYPQQDEAKTIKPVAVGGAHGDDADWIKLTWADGERGRSPGGMAVRTGRTQVVRNILAQPDLAPWHDEVRRRGCNSVIALPLKVASQVIGILCIQSEELDAFAPEEFKLLHEIANNLSYGIETLRNRAARRLAESELKGYAQKLRESLEQTVQAMALTVEVRDPYTHGHQRRVTQLALAIAREIGLSPEQRKAVWVAGTLHDLGKIYVPEGILSRPGRLSEIELELIKTHCQKGYEILCPIKFPWPIAQIVKQHHERMDGSGYPEGLKSEEILLEARILAVADVVEAMSSHRPYRPALGIEVALEEITKNKGILYDPAVVDACVKLFTEKGFKFN